MQRLYDVAAPAKLNLFLHVTGRRADGYHLLQSVFMLIDWCDTLHFEQRTDGRLTREDLGAPLPADDLVLRAARALQALAPPGSGAHIGIDKRIPSQAGMGGGSSDAASCLLALNRLWRLNLPLAQLEAIGLRLGADVPFFLRGANALVEGVGERITPIALQPARLAVVKPEQGLDTARIFAAPTLARDSAPIAAAILFGFAADTAAGPERSHHRYDFSLGHNDLQPVAEQLCPEIAQATAWLGSQGLQARMTGSGSAVFAQMPREFALRDAPSRAWQVRVCANLAAHPLVGWAV